MDVSCVEDTAADDRGGAATFTLVGDKNFVVLLSGKVAVKKTSAGYETEIHFGASVPTVSTTTSTSARGPTTTSTISYRNISGGTTVLLQPGQTVAILEGGGNSLTATLDKLPEGVPTGPAANLPVLGNYGALDANLKAVVKIVHADGTTEVYATMIAGEQTSLTSVKTMVEIPGKSGKTPIVQSIQLHLVRESGGLGVELTSGFSMPVVNSTTNAAAVARALLSGNGAPAAPATSPVAPSNLTATITYRNIEAHFDVAVKKLGQPITVFNDRGDTITLTLDRAD